MQVTLKIKRFNPEKDKEAWWGEYKIEAEPTDRLARRAELCEVVPGRHPHLSPVVRPRSLRLRRHADQRIEPLACKVLLQQPGPARSRLSRCAGIRVIKDLLVDMDAFLAKYRSVKPYLITKARPGKGTLAVAARTARNSTTPPSAFCAARARHGCPSFWGDSDYIGPAAIVNAHRFLFDSRDEGGEERMEVLNTRRRRVALPHHLQLRGSLPARHQRDPRHWRGEESAVVSEGLKPGSTQQRLESGAAEDQAAL